MTKTTLPENILYAINTVLPPGKNYPLHEPVFTGNEKKYLLDCIDSGFVSSVGQYVNEFEDKVKEFTQSRYAVATVNGTSALHISYLLAGIQPKDEVLVPTLTFVATVNAISFCQAIPHFVDSCDPHLGIDVKKLEQYLTENTTIKDKNCFNRQTGRRIKALVAVHVYGMPGEIDAMMDLCRKFHLELIEDAAESLGSYYQGRHTGNFGLAGVISFNGNKTITTGGGGMILLNDKDRAAFAKHLTTTAKTSSGTFFSHDRIGFNYRLPNLNAALGCAQMESLPDFLARKRTLAGAYETAFNKVEGVSLLTETNDVKSNFWLNTLLLDQPDASVLETILSETNVIGIQTRPAWRLMHNLPMFKQCPAMNLDGAVALEKRIINLPSSPNLPGLEKKRSQ